MISILEQPGLVVLWGCFMCVNDNSKKDLKVYRKTLYYLLTIVIVITRFKNNSMES